MWPTVCVQKTLKNTCDICTTEYSSLTVMFLLNQLNIFKGALSPWKFEKHCFCPSRADRAPRSLSVLSLCLSPSLSGMYHTWQRFTFFAFHELHCYDKNHRRLVSICRPPIGSCGVSPALRLLGVPVNQSLQLFSLADAEKTGGLVFFLARVDILVIWKIRGAECREILKAVRRSERRWWSEGDKGGKEE